MLYQVRSGGSLFNSGEQYVEAPDIATAIAAATPTLGGFYARHGGQEATFAKFTPEYIAQAFTEFVESHAPWSVKLIHPGAVVRAQDTPITAEMSDTKPEDTAVTVRVDVDSADAEESLDRLVSKAKEAAAAMDTAATAERDAILQKRRAKAAAKARKRRVEAKRAAAAEAKAARAKSAKRRK